MAKRQPESRKGLERLQKESKRRRTAATRPLRKRILIVCEGEETEPNYFESFKRFLPKNIIQVDIIGEGDNTINIVNIAIEERKKMYEKSIKSHYYQKYDEVWAVFDKDSFQDRRFNDAIKLAERENIRCAYSNEAFELWYLLHFHYYNTGISRSSYKGILTKLLGFKYVKNSKEMYEILKEKGNQSNAIKNATKLYNLYDHHKPAKENPSTTVFQLIEELNKFIPI